MQVSPWDDYEWYVKTEIRSMLKTSSHLNLRCGISVWVIAKYAVTFCFDDVCNLKKEKISFNRSATTWCMTVMGKGWRKQSHATKIIMLWKR